MKTSSSTVKRVRNYYDGTQFEYNVFLGIWKHHGLHYGYYDENHRSPSTASINLNCILAEKVEIKDGLKILDAGCGIGGSSLWLAQHYGVKVVGITLSDYQRKKAEKLSFKYGVDQKVTFMVRDFCDTRFDKNSFDVVWAIESVSSADDKRDFLKEAYRILKPGGKLVVSDGFLKKQQLNQKEQALMEKWTKGWVVPNMPTINQFAEYMENLGFKKVDYDDITEHVLPFSLWLHRMAKWFLPILTPLKWIRIFSQIQIDNGTSALLQYPALKQGLWAYMVYTGIK